MSRVASARCWAPGALVELEVLVDLRLAPALGRLVDRELDAAVAAGDDLRHQRRVLGRDRLVGEVDHLGHAEDVLVEADPLLHAAELDVADDVVDREQQVLVRRVGAGDRLEAGEERAVVAGAVDERVERLAVGGDRGACGPCRGRRRRRAARRRWARRGRRPRRWAWSTSGTESAIERTPSPWRAWWRAISVPARSVPVSTSRIAALLEHVRGAVAQAGLEPRVGDLAEAEGVLVEVGGLGGVADAQLDVVDAVERHEGPAARALRRGRRGGLRRHLPAPRSSGSPFMIPLVMALFNPDSLRRGAIPRGSGRDRPADRCAAA